MTCPTCRYEWKTRDQFITDPAITLIGFQADFDTFGENLYLFNHNSNKNRCDTTFSVYVSKFLDMYTGPIYDDLKFGSEECSGRCAKVDDMQKCNAPCKNVVAREIMLTLISIHQKNNTLEKKS